MLAVCAAVCFFSSRRRHTRCALVTGVQTCALPIFLLMAVLVARLGWQLPLVRDAERALYDARATAMAPHVGQDRRILLVTYNDETLFNTGIRSPLDRGILARALANIDAMRSEEHTSELQSLMRISYAVFCLKKKTHIQ